MAAQALEAARREPAQRFSGLESTATAMPVAMRIALRDRDSTNRVGNAALLQISDLLPQATGTGRVRRSGFRGRGVCQRQGHQGKLLATRDAPPR